MRAFFILLAFIAGIIFIYSGVDYLASHSPFLINSYTLLSILYAVVGLLLILSVICGFLEYQDYEPVKQIILLIISFIIFVGGYGYYQYHTTQIYQVSTTPSEQKDTFLTYAATDYWTTPAIEIKPNQRLFIYSRQPFRLAIGDIQAEPNAGAKDGYYAYNILTSIIDFTTSDKNSALLRITAKDKLQFRLTQEATATTALINVKVAESDNYNLAKKSESDYYWSWIAKVFGALFLLSLAGTGALFGGRELYRRHEIREAENKRKAEIRKEEERIKKQKRVEAEKIKKAQEEQRRAQEMKDRQVEFAKITADIDPDTLFED